MRTACRAVASLLSREKKKRKERKGLLRIACRAVASLLNSGRHAVVVKQHIFWPSRAVGVGPVGAVRKW